jgi:hypothetical protein
MGMSKEVVDVIEYHEKLIYKKGLIDGISMYSWMKDGVTYVGTTGKTLKKAIDEINNEK